jgi:hypothetical protein
MAVDFSSVWRKRDRAKYHLDALTRLSEIYEADYPYGVAYEAHADMTEHIWRAYVRRQPPPEWGIPIGEFLFNLRSCLDNLAYAFACSTTATPSDKTEFPIYRHKLGFDNNRHKISDLPAPVQAVIEELQPFQHGQQPLTWPPTPPLEIDGLTVPGHPGHTDMVPEHPASNPLWHLQVLNNVDKHRLIHVVVTTPLNYQFNMSPDWRQEAAIDFSPVHNGAVILKIVTPEHSGEMEMKGGITLGVCIPEVPNYLGGPGTPPIPIPYGLTYMMDRVESTIARLALLA